LKYVSPTGRLAAKKLDNLRLKLLVYAKHRLLVTLEFFFVYYVAHHGSTTKVSRHNLIRLVVLEVPYVCVMTTVSRQSWNRRAPFVGLSSEYLAARSTPSMKTQAMTVMMIFFTSYSFASARVLRMDGRLTENAVLKKCVLRRP
jgi:membrane-associated HD superfamily phosphohydrolase